MPVKLKNVTPERYPQGLDIGISPMPMGVAEAELWPRLNKAMEMLEIASRREPMNTTLERVYSELRRGREMFKTAIPAFRTPTLEEILSPNFDLSKSAWLLNRGETSSLDELSGVAGNKSSLAGAERYFTFNDLKKSVRQAEDFIEKFYK